MYQMSRMFHVKCILCNSSWEELAIKKLRMRNNLLLISIIAPFEQHYEKIISSLGEAIELVAGCRKS